MLTAQARQTVVSALPAQPGATPQSAAPASAHNKLTASSACLLPAKVNTQTSYASNVQLAHGQASRHSCSDAAEVFGPTCIAGKAQSASSTQAVPAAGNVHRPHLTVQRTVPAAAAHVCKSGPTTAATQAMASANLQPSASKANSSGVGLQVLLPRSEQTTHAPDRRLATPAVCPQQQHMNAVSAQKLSLEVHELALFTHPAMAEKGLQLLNAAEDQYGVVCEMPKDSSRHNTVFVQGVKLQVSS